MSLPKYEGPQTVSALFHQLLMRGAWGCIVLDLETIIVLSLIHIQFLPQKDTPVTNLSEVMVQGLTETTLLLLTPMPGDDAADNKLESLEKPINLFSRM